MTQQSQATNQDRSIFEWWYVAHFVLGIIYTGFVPILVPTYVLAVTKSATAIGVVMGILGLGFLLAPLIGNFAARFRAYRVTQLSGLLALALGSEAFAIAQEELAFVLAALLLGIGTATSMMINPTFIVGAKQSQAMEALRLTALNQTMILGQLVGGLTLAALTWAGLSFQARFLVMAGIVVVGLLITAATNESETGCSMWPDCAGDLQEGSDILATRDVRCPPTLHWMDRSDKSGTGCPNVDSNNGDNPRLSPGCYCYWCRIRQPAG